MHVCIYIYICIIMKIIQPSLPTKLDFWLELCSMAFMAYGICSQFLLVGHGHSLLGEHHSAGWGHGWDWSGQTKIHKDSPGNPSNICPKMRFSKWFKPQEFGFHKKTFGWKNGCTCLKFGVNPLKGAQDYIRIPFTSWTRGCPDEQVRLLEGTWHWQSGNKRDAPSTQTHTHIEYVYIYIYMLFLSTLNWTKWQKWTNTL